MRIRVVQHARVILMGGLRDVRSERLLVLSSSPHISIVCSTEALPSFRSLLDPSPMPLAQMNDYRLHPIEWAGGSAAVLMHEAVGHPAERGQDVLRWPEWLSVRDLPTDAMNGGLDDCGQRTRESELTGGSQSLAWRRSSFRDAPMKRMSSLAVRARGVAAIPPADRLRVRLLSGGRYDPLTDSVTLGVAAADLIRGSISMPLAPFTIREPRRAVAEALVGECGPEAMYPGVICIDEGQRVFVPSRACGLLTRPFAEAG